MIIVGNATSETLDGTGDADVIMALGGNDTVNALGGDDVIFGGPGADQLFGGEGNDTFVEDQPTTFIPPNPALGTPAQSERFDGGNGTDTIELRTVPAPITTNVGVTSFHSFTNATLISIERLAFASTPGSVVQANLTVAQVTSSGLTQLVGGAGQDFVAFSGTPGTLTMPVLQLIAWSAAPVNAWEAGSSDFLVLLAPNVVNSVNTLNAAAGLDTLQVLIGGIGNDTLNGSANADRLDGGGGINTLFGNGGNDLLVIANTSVPTAINGQLVFGSPTQFTGAGSTYDGGAGTDLLGIGGSVNFQGTLVGIEGINLLPGFTPPVINTTRQGPAFLTMDLAHFAMLPTTALFRGVGVVDLALNQGESFDFSGYVIEPGSSIVFLFEGASDLPGVAVTWKGTATSDVFRFGSDFVTATGGGGADLFGFQDAHATVTDFTHGEDAVDLTGTGITTGQRLADFIHQVGNDVVLSLTSGGETDTLTLQNVTLADLTDADFIYDALPFSPINFQGPTDDVLFGYQFGDQLHGGEGNDRIYGGGGADRLFGEGGNDTLILDGLVAPIGPGGVIAAYDGGSGFDTLELRPAGINFPSANGLSTGYVLTNVQISGIERVVFASTAQNGILFALLAEAVPSSGITQLVGGAGPDTFVTLATNTSGNTNFTMPAFTLTNWTSLAEPYRTAGGDTLVLNAISAGNFTLNAHDGSGATQALLGGAGNDTLNGSDGIDFLNGNGGTNVLRGNGGNDALVIANTVVQTGQFSFATSAFTGAGSTFDGGAGFDVLSVGGAVNFAGTLSGIEGIYLQSAFASTNPGGAGSQAAARLSLSAASLAQLPGNLSLDGTGTVAVALAPGDGYDGLGFIVRDGAQVTVEVAGSAANDTLRLGAARELVDGGDGIDTAVLAGASGAYTVAAGANGSVLIGEDALRNVELFRFLDGLFTFDGTRLVPKANVAPTAVDDHATVNEDSTVTGNVIVGSDSDPDAGQVLSVTAVDGSALTGQPIHGTYGALTIAADGSYSYVADADVVDAFAPGTHLAESFGYTIADGAGGFASATLSIDIATIADNRTLSGGNGSDTLTGDGRDDILLGGRGDDVLAGSGGADRLYGGQGDDRLSGGNGFDLLVGGQGADRLDGGAGEDLLIGGKGGDILTGGAGADVFDFSRLDGTDRDTITDFEVGVDHIHLGDGLTVTGLGYSGASTVLSLSNGGSILLQGVHAESLGGLFSADLPDWSAGLPLI